MLVLAGCSAGPENPVGPVNVAIVKSETGFQLSRDGEPYVIKGAGMAIDDIERFAAHGGNSIRTWSTTAADQDTQALLDKAHAYGVTVALCLPLEHERHGFDYDDPDAVARQFETFRKEVVRYRDHPALLFWIIGNELNHSYTNPRVYDAVNDIATMIEELDPNHPTTTAVAGFKEDVIAEINARAPAIDFISFQTYGTLFALPERIKAANFEQPFMVTEWGTLGYWEMEQTAWGAPVELTSSEKADVILRGHREILAALEGQLIGSYIFKWGQKQERTPTWFGLFTEAGEETEAVDVMHYVWNGAWPDNRTPRVRSMMIAGQDARQSVVIAAGAEYEATFDVFDNENDPLSYRWEIKPESESTRSGGDFEQAIPSLEGLLSNPAAASTAITAPAPGRYRLFAYAFDDRGHAAHANIAFLATAGDAQ